MGAHSNSQNLDGSGPFYVALDVVSGAQNIAGNFTDFAWGLYAGCADNGWGTFSGNAQFWSVNIAGVVGSGTWTLDFTPAGTSGRRYAIAGNPALAVPHNADGTRPGFPNYGSIDSDHSSVGDGTVVTWADAPTIPRASTSVWNVQGTPKYIGTSYQLNTNRADASFTHDITYNFGSASGTIGTGVGATVNWTPPTSLLTQIPNSPAGTGTITTVTKQGGTIIGTTYSSIELTAALTVVPDFTTVTNSENVAGVAANVGGYVQGISKLNLAITGAAGVSGSTITSYKIEVAGQTINAISGVTPAPLATSGTVVITGTVTDSRGRIKAKTVNITVLAYVPPVITTLSVERSLSGGTPDDDGTYFRINLNAAVQSLIVTTQRNALVYRISTRLRGTSTWTLKSNTAPGGITFNSFVTVGTYSITSSYDILVEVVDDFSVTAVQLLIGVASIFQHWHGNLGTGFGKYHQRGFLDGQGDAYFQRGVDDWRAITNIGTAAERDAVYGVPASDATRVALANRKVTWFNTDRGWWEEYFATTALSGLTVTGLELTAVSGWYPVANGPQGVLYAAGNEAHTAGSLFTNWRAFGTSPSSKNVPDALMSRATEKLVVGMAGRYRAYAYMTYPAGAGTGAVSFHGVTKSTAGIDRSFSIPVPLYAGFTNGIGQEISDLLLFDTGYIYWKTDAASWAVGTADVSHMSLTYIGPPLVSV